MKLNQNILADIFQDGMILPKNKMFKIGGKITPQEKVTVNFNHRRYETISDKLGNWKIDLPAVSSENEYKLTASTAQQNQEISDIRFGLVYLLSGQSNIEFRLKDEEHFDQVKQQLISGKYNNLYYYNVPQVDYIDAKNNSIKPEGLNYENWHHVDSQNCGDMSAVGYYMMEELAKKGITEPIAIVDCFKGGTSASVWIKHADLAEDLELKTKFLDEYHKAVDNKTWADFDRETDKYNKLVEKHNRDLAGYLKRHPGTSLSTAKNIVGHTPWPPPARPDLFTRPSGLYATMLPQVKYCSFNGMVWYQGENDTDRAEQYAKLLPLLINTWRKELADPSLVIKIIQLPGYADYPDDSGALIRQTQLYVSRKMPNVDLVSFVDGGEEHNIHPTNKKIVGERLGKIWFGNDYAGTPFVEKVECYQDKLILVVARSQSLRLKNNVEIVITFKDGSKELVKLCSQNLNDNQITLSLDQTQTIRSISYGYENYPKEIGVYNEMGYPLSPFWINF